MREACSHNLLLVKLLGFFLTLISAGPLVGAEANLAEPGNSGHRYLLVFQTSKGMQPRTEGVFKAVQSLLGSSMNGQLRPGDTLGLWTFNDSLYAGRFPLQTWEPEDKAGITTRVLTFLKARAYERQARLDPVLFAVRNLIEESEHITVVLFSDGAEVLRGTPFDQRINEFYRLWQTEQQRARMPFVTVLRAAHGRITDFAVTAAPLPVEMPALPNEARSTPVTPKTVLPQPTPPVASAQLAVKTKPEITEPARTEPHPIEPPPKPKATEPAKLAPAVEPKPVELAKPSTPENRQSTPPQSTISTASATAALPVATLPPAAPASAPTVAPPAAVTTPSVDTPQSVNSPPPPAPTITPPVASTLAAVASPSVNTQAISQPPATPVASPPLVATPAAVTPPVVTPPVVTPVETSQPKTEVPQPAPPKAVPAETPAKPEPLATNVVLQADSAPPSQTEPASSPSPAPNSASAPAVSSPPAVLAERQEPTQPAESPTSAKTERMLPPTQLAAQAVTVPPNDRASGNATMLISTLTLGAFVFCVAWFFSRRGHAAPSGSLISRSLKRHKK